MNKWMEENKKNLKIQNSKKICIFGADGRTGKYVVEQALLQGYKVIAFVYSEDSIGNLPPQIKFVVGDILIKEDVENAIKKKPDMVISVVGHIKGSDPLMQTKGIRNITDSMKKYGVKRIVSLTGTGVREKGDKITILDRIANFLVKLLDKERIVDGIKHAEVLKKSGLDWSILRVLKLSKKQSDKSYLLTSHGPVENFSHRKRVAKALVDLLEKNEWIGKSPIMSEPK